MSGVAIDLGPRDVRAALARGEVVLWRPDGKCRRCGDVGEVHAMTKHGLTIRPCPRCDGVRRCPYGDPGDLLWVREAWAPCPCDCGAAYYREKFDARGYPAMPAPPPWRNARSMPRRASRITLRVVDARRVPLHSVTDAELAAGGWSDVFAPAHGVVRSARDGFAAAWDRANGRRSPWSSNPAAWRVVAGLEPK